MTEVIAVAGAGGKSSYIRKEALRLKAQGIRCAVTTTTHIHEPACDPDFFYAGSTVPAVTSELAEVNTPGPDGRIPVFGFRCGDGKLSGLSPEEWKKLCGSFDVVLTEADGSAHHPLKIPNGTEPVIPENVSEIDVIMGRQAAGRPLSEVCHRFGQLDPERWEAFRRSCAAVPELPVFSKAAAIPVTRELEDCLADFFYLRPLRSRFPDIPVRYIPSDFLNDHENSPKQEGPLGLVLLASGSGKRFGGNKLLADLGGMPLSVRAFTTLREAGLMLEQHGIKTILFPVTADGAVERAIAAAAGEGPAEVRFIHNPGAAEGMAASVRCGASAASREGCGSILFFAADQPFFPAEDISRLVREFLASGKRMACAYSDHPANPALFRADMLEELLSLKGDTGPRKLLAQRAADVHHYVVSDRKLVDIDTQEDLVSSLLSTGRIDKI